MTGSGLALSEHSGPAEVGGEEVREARRGEDVPGEQHPSRPAQFLLRTCGKCRCNTCYDNTKGVFDMQISAQLRRVTKRHSCC